MNTEHGTDEGEHTSLFNIHYLFLLINDEY
jgi:hypothetical protein